uniref:C2 domain-containing protein n=1 Tax=Terrapene triunguis TaxID=2587831 RepID=A0A674K537_9SAUR
ASASLASSRIMPLVSFSLSLMLLLALDSLWNGSRTPPRLTSISLALQFGRTEVIDNTLNPDFVRKFILDYFFEEKQSLRFDLYDVDSKSPDLSKHDFLGQAFCTLGEIVGSAGSPRWAGGIPRPWCHSQRVCFSLQDVATMQFCANKLDKKDFFGKSDPFMVFYRSNEDGTFTICHKTEVVKNTLNPVWQAFSIPVRALCNGDYDRTIKVEVYDWDRDGSHDFIGEFTTSYRELARGQSQFNVYEVTDLTNTHAPPLLCPHTAAGLCDPSLSPSGNPSQSTSLHYMNPYQLNAYAMALKAVGEIIQDYDSDKMFPALGFGAKIPPDGHVSHEFPLNGNADNPYCSGIEGILEAYHKSLKTVQLYGPTNFAPVVNHVARYIQLDGSQYFVLLIITDGVISDMAQTKEAIVNVSNRGSAHLLCHRIPQLEVSPALSSLRWREWSSRSAPVSRGSLSSVSPVSQIPESAVAVDGRVAITTSVCVLITWVTQPPSVPTDGHNQKLWPFSLAIGADFMGASTPEHPQQKKNSGCPTPTSHLPNS